MQDAIIVLHYQQRKLVNQMFRSLEMSKNMFFTKKNFQYGSWFFFKKKKCCQVLIKLLLPPSPQRMLIGPIKTNMSA